MPKVHRRWSTFAALILLTAGNRAEPDDAVPRTSPPERLGRILDEWQAHSDSYSTLDLHFIAQTEVAPISDPTSVCVGRIILQPHRVVMSTTSQPEETMDARAERRIWTKDALHEILPGSKEHFVYPVSSDASGDRNRLSAFVALPFLWNMSAESLKQRYRVELLGEQAAVWLLRITPLNERAHRSFSKAILHLERETYLPRRYILTDLDGKTTTDYRVTGRRINQAIPEGAFRLPEGDGWRHGTISPRFSRIFNQDMLP